LERPLRLTGKPESLESAVNAVGVTPSNLKGPVIIEFRADQSPIVGWGDTDEKVDKAATAM